jgi:cobalt-precorrin-5B (C1)-methyltransferase
MIRQALRPLLPAGQGARVTIGVADGETLAKKTLNGRLGIVGGLSILGTTGIVMPYSHDAYRESITCALDVARAMGLDRVVLSTGRSSEAIARKIFPDVSEPGFVLMGDHFAHAVHEAVQHGMRHLTIACFPAKLLKMAGGADNTHASASRLDLGLLATMAVHKGAGKSVRAVLAHTSTVRGAFDSMPGALRQRVCCLLAQQIGEQIRARSGNRVSSDALIIAYDNSVLYRGRS